MKRVKSLNFRFLQFRDYLGERKPICTVLIDFSDCRSVIRRTHSVQWILAIRWIACMVSAINSSHNCSTYLSCRDSLCLSLYLSLYRQLHRFVSCYNLLLQSAFPSSSENCESLHIWPTSFSSFQLIRPTSINLSLDCFCPLAIVYLNFR